MRRDSAPARALVATLDAASVNIGDRAVTGRTVERLSHDGLLPLDASDPERVVGHFRALDAAGYGPGRPADHVALSLLGQGYPCERARSALLAGLGLAGLPDELPDAVRLGDLVRQVGATPEVVAQVVEQATDAGAGGLGALGGLVAPLLDVLGRFTAPAGRVDYANALIGPLDETPEQRRSAIVRTFVDVDLGEAPVDPSPVADVVALVNGEQPDTFAGLTYDEDTDARDVLGELPGLALEVIHTARTAPLAALAEGAQRWRALVGLVGELLGLRWSEVDKDKVAGLLAAVLLVWERRSAEDAPPPLTP